MNKQTPGGIKNPKTHQVPKTPLMNERDFVNDALSTEKYMTASYSIAMNEASHNTFYQTLVGICQETQDCQRDLYNLMFKNAWYGVVQETNQNIQQSVKQFSNYLQTQDPYNSGNMPQ
jgi:spore coat protein CotF